jgi:hypothetical protein
MVAALPVHPLSWLQQTDALVLALGCGGDARRSRHCSDGPHFHHISP